jgi:thioredoxin-like negative regulator of GroEL
VAVCFLAATPLAWGSSAEAVKLLDGGTALLAKGDFDGALAMFKSASEADPENTACYREFSILKQVINYRGKLAQEKDEEMWARYAGGLYNYYRMYHIHGEALSLAQQMYDKMGCGSSAGMLADAQLALNKNAEAAELLAGLCKTKQTARTQTLHAVALARLSKLEDAKTTAAAIELPKEQDPRLYFDLARMHALLGDRAQALKMLTRCFESTPSAWLDDMKSEAKASSDLRSLTQDDQFKTVLATESKIKGGCGGCSKKGSCSGKSSCTSKEKAGCEHDHGDKDKKGGCSHDH